MRRGGGNEGASLQKVNGIINKTSKCSVAEHFEVFGLFNCFVNSVLMELWALRRLYQVAVNGLWLVGA